MKGEEIASPDSRDHRKVRKATTDQKFITNWQAGSLPNTICTVLAASHFIRRLDSIHLKSIKNFASRLLFR